MARSERLHDNVFASDPTQLLIAFPSLPPPTRLRLLEDLLPLLSTPELLMLNSNIGPRLTKDFLKDLPVELGLHVLSFVSRCGSYIGLIIVRGRVADIQLR
jgi:hypothetical protein